MHFFCISDTCWLKSIKIDQSRPKSIITKNCVIDFYRHPIFVDWLVSNLIDNDRLTKLLTCYVLSKFNRSPSSTLFKGMSVNDFIIQYSHKHVSCNNSEMQTYNKRAKYLHYLRKMIALWWEGTICPAYCGHDWLGCPVILSFCLLWSFLCEGFLLYLTVKVSPFPGSSEKSPLWIEIT